MHLPGKPGHNPYINQCDSDNNLIYIPSQIYRFNQLKEKIRISEHTCSHMPIHCGMVIVEPDTSVMKNVLDVCQQISCQQSITNLYLTGMRCHEDIKTDDKEAWPLFNLSQTCDVLTLEFCEFPLHTMSHLIGQIHSCPSLTCLNLQESLQSQELCESVCKELKHLLHLKILNLSQNPLGNSGIYLAESIQAWGGEPPLEMLILQSCHMAETAWAAVLSALSSCKLMKWLWLLENTIGAAGIHLAESIRVWGPNPLLEAICLDQCEMPVAAWAAVLSALSSCQMLKETPDLRKAGRHIADVILAWGAEVCVKELNLQCFWIPQEAWAAVLSALSYWKPLQYLHLNNNTIGAVGVYLAESIQAWGPEPPLEQLDLEQCEMPEEAWAAVLSALSSCRQMKKLWLNHNTIGAAGIHLAESIRAWGPDPALQILGLEQCEMPEEAWAGILPALLSCRQLKNLSLANNVVGVAGVYLAESIQAWGPEPPLEKLDVKQCLMPEKTWAAVLSALSSCKKLTEIPDMRMAGVHIADVILAWGPAPLLKLDLQRLQIPPEAWPAVLTALSSCKKLQKLSLSKNSFGVAGVLLAKSIQAWGPEPHQDSLGLEECEMPEEAWVTVLSALASCKNLTEFYLSNNTFGETGVHVAHLIEAWGPEHPLRRLDLDGCQMPQQVCAAVLKALSFLKQLKELWLDKNTIGVAGVYLTESIQAWGPESQLHTLHLEQCDMPEEIWKAILAVLSSCKWLQWIYLSHNKLSACLQSFTPKMAMIRLHLTNTSLTAVDINHLTHLVREGWWFYNLHLSDNDLNSMEVDVRDLLLVCCTERMPHGNRTLNLYLKNTNLFHQFQEEMNEMCEDTGVMIDWLNELPDDEALHT